MSWKENRTERKLMALERQKERLMNDMSPRKETRTYREPIQRGRVEPRDESYQRDVVQPERETRSMDELGKIAEKAFLSMPYDMKPGEICYVMATMMKMLCLVLDE